MAYFAPGIVNCGPPQPPVFGSLGIYNHTREGAAVTYSCNPGYRPSAAMVSVCDASMRWMPAPENHNCTLVGGMIIFGLC